MPHNAPALARSLDEVLLNIGRFAGVVAASGDIQERLGRVHAWYAVRAANGWAFGPSKFIGYRKNNADQYIRTSTAEGGAHGGTTERELRKWFTAVDLQTPLGQELLAALRDLLRTWGRTPRAGVRISVLWSEQTVPPPGVERNGESDFRDRVTSDPAIAGGRPCIRGTRMRVSDIVDMLAAGATSAEVLEDYPYLAPEDISAALAYAARATDHRVIIAA